MEGNQAAHGVLVYSQGWEQEALKLLTDIRLGIWVQPAWLFGTHP